MLSPGFVDILLGLLLITFSIKGYVTGFIRSVVTIVAVLVAFGVSAALPTLLNPMLAYSVHADAPNFMVINRLASFFLFFAIFQVIGFLMTGLLEKIGLGTSDKIVGLGLGVVTGIIVGCVPGVAIYQSGTAYAFKPNQKLFKTSLFMRTYQPIVKGIAKPAKPPRPKRVSAAESPVVT